MGFGSFWLFSPCVLGKLIACFDSLALLRLRLPNQSIGLYCVGEALGMNCLINYKSAGVAVAAFCADAWVVVVR